MSLLETMNVEIFTSIVYGGLIGISFLIGIFIPMIFKISNNINAKIVGFAAGIFFSAIAFSLIDESVKEAGVLSMLLGLTLGSIVFSITYHLLNKKSNPSSNSFFKNSKMDIETEESIFSEIPNFEENNKNNAFDQNFKPRKNKYQHNKSNIIILGTLLDSIPEGLFIGILIGIQHQAVIGAVFALFLGNLATAIEGAQRMIEQKNSRKEIVVKWLFVFIIISSTTPLGYFLVNPLTNTEISIILGFAAGALLAFITEELIPTAFKKNQYHIGLSVTFGFIIGYLLFHFL